MLGTGVRIAGSGRLPPNRNQRKPQGQPNRSNFACGMKSLHFRDYAVMCLIQIEMTEWGQSRTKAEYETYESGGHPSLRSTST